MKSIKKVLVAVAVIAAIIVLLVADGKSGEEACGGEGSYNQTTGKCISK